MNNLGRSATLSKTKKSLKDLKNSRKETARKKRVRQSSDTEERYDDEEGQVEDEPETSLSEIQKIRVSRDELEKWCFAPFFKDTVVNCLVRIGLGSDKITKQPVYRIGKIDGFYN